MESTRVSSVLAAYTILGLPPDAPFGDARQAFRVLARRLHPDVAGGDSRSAARYAEVRGAFETLAQRVGRTPRALGVARYQVAGMVPAYRGIDVRA